MRCSLTKTCELPRVPRSAFFAAYTLSRTPLPENVTTIGRGPLLPDIL